MIEIGVALLPVFIFLGVLIYFDSYKLVKVKNIITLIFSGMAAAVLSFLINSYLLENFIRNVNIYVRYGAPVIEELIKAVPVIYLISRNKIGFMADALIYGFAIGAGFSCLENIYYLNELGSSNILLWIIRGFGTAVMHGGTTSIFAIITKRLHDRSDQIKLFTSIKRIIPGVKYYNPILIVLPGLLTAVVIHSFFNHLILPPQVITLLQLILLPLLLMFIFKRSEEALKEWMEKGLDNEVLLLQQIDDGIFSETHAGKYLLSLQDRFEGPVLADMLCLIKIHVELSIKAKGVMLFRKGGLPVTIDEEVKDKLNELKYLEKSIGRTGKTAVSPIFSQSTKDLWQIYLLAK